jgi:hypothetical protein
MVVKTPKFQIGDRIYHVTKESEQGVVIDVTYSLRTANWLYIVSFSPGSECSLYEDEISESKIF